MAKITTFSHRSSWVSIVERVEFTAWSALWVTLVRRLPRMESASSKKSTAPVSAARRKAALMFLGVSPTYFDSISA